MDAISNSRGDGIRLSALMEIALLATDSTKRATGSSEGERLLPQRRARSPGSRAASEAAPCGGAASRSGSPGGIDGRLKRERSAENSPDSVASASFATPRIVGGGWSFPTRASTSTSLNNEPHRSSAPRIPPPPNTPNARESHRDSAGRGLLQPPARRTGRPAVQRLGRRLTLPFARQALRARQRRDHTTNLSFGGRARPS